MKISTKGRYGLRAMVDLAINSSGEHVALNCIAERQNVSDNYLEQVFSTLRKAGLVKSIKGAQGGYVLSRNPSSISVGEILRILEGDLSVVDESEIENLPFQSIEYCLKASVWDKINERINTVIDSLTLEDMINEYKKNGGSSSYMYHI